MAITPIEFVTRHGDPATWLAADFETYETITRCDLPTALAGEDAAEESGDLSADHRVTCHIHQSWASACADHPLHTDPHGTVLRSALRAVAS
ncbi:hypothetical protein H3146_14850 [Streptomyces sp. OF3]|uniref:Uncharacterized protein n=1 Tax=Streptomyces alkaliterrae TaxID=2213162 RepID=A0A7W3WM05_9ACTN|nr:hypothetical protein [Streptomyces alkaliterrae]MBB1254630.1 hypothetical protein [Streptomyces alkaliterrae]